MSQVGEFANRAIGSISEIYWTAKAGVQQIMGVTISQWLTYFNDVCWSAITGSWGGSWKSDAGGDLVLSAIGKWAEGYRPTQCKVTYGRLYTIDAVSVRNADGSVTYGSAAPGAVSSVQFAIACTGDIGKLYSSNTDGGSHSVTNIEFY